MKFLIAFCFIAIALQCTSAVSNSWGSRQNGDSLVASKFVIRGAISGTIQTDTLIYNSPQSQWIVTYINIVDEDPSSGADGFIMVGGVGKRSAHLYFRSKYSGGINMNAQIYARRRGL